MPVANTGAAVVLQNAYRNLLEEVEAFYNGFDFLAPFAAEVRELRTAIGKPFTTAVFGRMKTGKSSIINALLGADLVVTGVNETTATINVISRASTAEECNTFRVYRKDGFCESFPLEDLQRYWSGGSEEVEERVKATDFLQLFFDAPSLSLHEIIDTPGTGAVVSAHEQIAQEFIRHRKPDALIYVFGVTARTDDEKNLTAYLENALPYNSVGVLHKWEETYWKSNGDWVDISKKCETIKTELQRVISNVIPVSAPLAQFATKMADSYLEQLLQVIRSDAREEILELLQDEEEWGDDTTRKQLYENAKKKAHMPWVCFKVAVREALNQPNITVAAYRERLLALSGIQTLNLFLDRNFYKEAEIIRQQNQYRKFEQIRKKANVCITSHLASLRSDIKQWTQLESATITSPYADKLKCWINQKSTQLQKTYKQLVDASTAFDKKVKNSLTKQILEDVEALQWCLLHSHLVSEEHYKILKEVIDLLAEERYDNNLKTQAIAILHELKQKTIGADPEGGKYLRHFTTRISFYLSKVHEGINL